MKLPKRFAYRPICGSAREICEFFDREHRSVEIDPHVKAKAIKQGYKPRVA